MRRPSRKIGTYNSHKERKITNLLKSTISESTYGPPPPRNTFKLNFDRASKGNPRKAGFGGIFRDHEGLPLLIFFGNIGWDTNNSAELEGLATNC